MRAISIRIAAAAAAVVALGLSLAVAGEPVRPPGVVCMLSGDFLTREEADAWRSLENCPGSTDDMGPKINPSPDDAGFPP